MKNIKKINQMLLSNDVKVIYQELCNLEDIDYVPIETQRIIFKLSEHSDREVQNYAVICLKKCVDLFDSTKEILLKMLESERWHIRANASKSLAYLGANDQQVIEQLMQLIGDNEGHDFSPEESAIEALGIIGKPAIECVPALIKMAHDEMDGEKWETRLILLFESLVKIDQGSSEFINLLIRGVNTCQSVGIVNAIRHLTSFGSKAKAVLPYLEQFVNQEEWLEGDCMTDESDELTLLKALFFIGGSQHHLLNKYIENLKSSDYQEGRLEAIEFERTWLNHL